MGDIAPYSNVDIVLSKSKRSMDLVIGLKSGTTGSIFPANAFSNSPISNFFIFKNAWVTRSTFSGRVRQHLFENGRRHLPGDAVLVLEPAALLRVRVSPFGELIPEVVDLPCLSQLTMNEMASLKVNPCTRALSMAANSWPSRVKPACLIVPSRSGSSSLAVAENIADLAGKRPRRRSGSPLPPFRKHRRRT